MSSSNKLERGISVPFLILLAALVAFGPLSIDMYLPSLPTIAENLGASQAKVQWSISGFLVGFCIGMLFYGPLSDRYGRKTILIIGIFLYLLSSLACFMAASADQLVLFRIIQAIGGGAASVLARAIVRDLLPLDKAAHTLSIMHVVTMIAPLIAPLIGGYLMLWFGWRSLFLGLFLFGLVCFISVLFIKETLPAEHRGGSIAKAFSAYWHILLDKNALGYILCMGMTFAGMFAYITGSSFVFIKHFGVPDQYFGWVFGVNVIGIMIVTFAASHFVKQYGSRPILRIGTTVACLAGAFLLVVAYFEWGGMWLIMLFLFCFVSVTGTIGANCIACLMSLYPKQAGAASALAVAAQFGLGFIASFIVGLLHFYGALNMALVVAFCGFAGFMALRMVD